MATDAELLTSMTCKQARQRMFLLLLHHYYCIDTIISTTTSMYNYIFVIYSIMPKLGVRLVFVAWSEDV